MKIRMMTGLIGLFAMTGAAAAQDEGGTMIVLDGSGSMWGQIGGTAKIEIARDAIGRLTADWPQDRLLGVMAYGHRREGDCGDIEMLLTPGPLDRSAVKAALDGVTPRGKTPVGASVRAAAETVGQDGSVVVVTDGLENCGADLCALGDELEASDAGFTAHLIGFDVEDAGGQLACLAEATGGQYIPAADADSLIGALQQVSTTEPEPEPTGPRFFDEFERAELGPDWTVNNPDPSGFILDDGTLITMTVEPGYMGDAPDQANVFRWTAAEFPDGDWDLSTDFTARLGEVQSLGGRRAIVQVGRYADVDNTISAYVYRQGNSNDDLWLRLRAMSGGTETRAEVEIAGNVRGYELAQILRDFEEKGARLTISKRGRDYVGRLSMNGWSMQEGGPEVIETDPIQVLRTTGDPALFAGTLGSKQTVAEFDRIEITEVK
ncbi:VWA domain-containing protein [Roseivivax sp. GX 12232]|uniref:vWA domain-containing protein n=1 Tax=Roseivivax sp. GX 12232 TaxID=2900547 RepID=UPI001E4FAA57|nr:VWA domain-containing protein [Roseivivax sp. GX 12232]MCE0507361.1 VWA domain-containing protein [Roseivivax sp. GX 12232]